MTDGWVPTIREDDLTEGIRSDALAEDADPISHFKSELDAIAEHANGVEEGNRAAALAWAVERAPTDAVAFTDASDFPENSDGGDEGAHDLRDHTK